MPHDTLAKIKDPAHTPLDAAHLEEQRVKGAIKTDFILSAEIMTIALSAIDPAGSVVFKAAVLAVIAIVITAAVYGAVAIIVKADDVGLHLADSGRTAFGRKLGAAVVRGMPGFMTGLTVVGTAAMLWVGGNIVVHALHEMGFHPPYDLIKGAAVALGQGNATIEWAVTALLDGILGVVLGLLLMPVIAQGLKLFGKTDDAAAH